jgi:hypothetical protein
LLIVDQDLPLQARLNQTLDKLTHNQLTIEPIDKPETISIQKDLACPARFERATYALEEFVAVQKSNNFNSLQRKNGTV